MPFKIAERKTSASAGSGRGYANMTIGKIRKYAITCINRFTTVNNIPQGQFARASRDLMFIVVNILTMPITTPFIKGIVVNIGHDLKGLKTDVEE